MDDAEALLAARELAYSVIARAYAEEPDEAFFKALMGDCMSMAASLLDGEPGARLEDALERARSFVGSDGGRPSPDCMSGLRQEYVRMLIGPGPLRVVPRESAHSAGGRALCRNGVLGVREAYREAGFLPARFPQVADDGIGLEFDFMAKLAQRTSEAFRSRDVRAYEDGIDRSAGFLEDHLLTWIGDYASEVRARHGACFYAEVAEFAALCARRDADSIGRLRGSLR